MVNSDGGTRAQYRPENTYIRLGMRFWFVFALRLCLASTVITITKHGVFLHARFFAYFFWYCICEPWFDPPRRTPYLCKQKNNLGQSDAWFGWWWIALCGVSLIFFSFPLDYAKIFDFFWVGTSVNLFNLSKMLRCTRVFLQRFR